ncbi:MAG: hypothetical protein K8R25_04590 [Methanosarcinales archaeon]|nr:hypothetical protein [Methanosarcinales archaeon]
MEKPQKQYPGISENAWISETAIIVGYVTIADDVFVAKNAVIMADYERCSLL